MANALGANIIVDPYGSSYYVHDAYTTTVDFFSVSQIRKILYRILINSKVRNEIF